MDIISTTEEKVAIRINPQTSTGKPATLDGLATLSILTGGATAEAATQDEIDADTAAGKPGLVGYLISEDNTGISTWGISADADLGEGVDTISDGGTYTYNHPQAASLGVTNEVLAK
jgi:hypothetical protein